MLLSSTNNTARVDVMLAPGPDVIPVSGDYDGDGRDDAAYYRSSSGEWRILTSSSGYQTTMTHQIGVTGGVPVAGDYDGDGRTDPAVFLPSTGEWRLLLSASGAAVSRSFGRDGDLPAPADYDGDGRTDLAFYRPSTGAWHVLTSSSEFTWTIVRTLAAVGIPVAGDYDGDGLADFALYDSATGTWFIQPAAQTDGTGTSVVWGSGTDLPVPADYDGDGRIDPAVYQSSGTWTILRSGDNYATSAVLSLGGGGVKPLVPR